MTISPAFADVLRGGRVEFNRRHAQARHRYPGMDGAAFLDLLAGPVDAIVAAVAETDRAAVPSVVDVLYDLSLSLFGQRWIGPGGRAPAILDLWLAMAQNAPLFVASDPHRLMSALANAQVHWATQENGIGWSQTVIALATRARNVDELLTAGQVAAWRHGLAHYRESALDRARDLEPSLAAIALGIGLREWTPDLIAALREDRWFRPDARQPVSRPFVATHIGAFVGFGGGFEAPPLASLHLGELLLTSGRAHFGVYADAFGATLQPTVQTSSVSAQSLPPGWRIEGADLIFRAGRLSFAEKGAITSAVAHADILLVTHAYAHAASVIALPAP